MNHIAKTFLVLFALALSATAQVDEARASQGKIWVDVTENSDGLWELCTGICCDTVEPRPATASAIGNGGPPPKLYKKQKKMNKKSGKHKKSKKKSQSKKSGKQQNTWE